MCVCVCVCVCVCEKAKLIRGDPPKIALKGRLSPPKRKIWPLQKHADFHFEGTILFFQLFLLFVLIARRLCRKFEKVKFILRSLPVCRREIYLEIQVCFSIALLVF